MTDEADRNLHLYLARPKWQRRLLEGRKSATAEDRADFEQGVSELKQALTRLRIALRDLWAAVCGR